MNLLKRLAWKILGPEIRENYIHRGFFNDYTQWMSRDFPIMTDMYEAFKDRPWGQPTDVCRHREAMAKKYKIKSTTSSSQVCTNQPH